MRIRLKLVLAITVMVSAMVILLSALYLSQLLSERIQQSYRHTDIAAHQVMLAARAAIEHGMAHVALPPNDPAALNDAVNSRPAAGCRAASDVVLVHPIRADHL